MQGGLKTKFLVGGTVIVFYFSFLWILLHVFGFGVPLVRLMSFWYIFVFFLVFLLLPLWLGLKCWVFRPLEALIRSHAKAMRNDLEAAIIPETAIPEDEIGDVFRSHNAMLRALVSYHNQLDKEKRELNERMRLAALGADVGIALTRNPHLQQSLQQCAEAMVRHLDAAFARIWTLNTALDLLELQASAGLYTHLDGAHGRIPTNAPTKIGRIAQVHQPHLTNTVVDDPLVTDREWAKREGMVAFAGYPLIVEDHLVGVMAMFARKPLGEGTLHALASVADGIALGIERKQTDEARRQLERQCIQSERMASVGLVAAGIVHNLKNPLTGVQGFAELLKISHPEIREVDKILSAATQMRAMIANILSKSRKSKDAEWLDINELLKHELDFLQADPTFKHEVEKTVRLAENLPRVKGVYADFSQVFGNLLRNAVEAMYGRKTKRLRLATSRTEAAIVVEIEDTGCGIPGVHLSKLFDPFFTTKTGHGKNDGPEGTGLGLYMTRHILDTYTAEIQVESQVDRGTLFRVLIPAEAKAPSP